MRRGRGEPQKPRQSHAIDPRRVAARPPAPLCYTVGRTATGPARHKRADPFLQRWRDSCRIPRQREDGVRPLKRVQTRKKGRTSVDDQGSVDRRRAAKGRAGVKTINLALQGGGAHGAFAWGVIDRLLDDERIEFEGISATSAGAMNAAVTAYGLTVGGRDGARAALAVFWRRISDAAPLSPLRPSPFDKLLDRHSMDSNPAFLFFDLMTRVLSPYQFNPFDFNPLRDVLEASVDFEVLRAGNVVKLFLCATNVRTGKVKIFENAEITPSAVLASGCLPFLFRAVEIDGEPYWDGGYMGNPAIFPLIYGCQSADVMIVHINPITRDAVPQTATDILNRLN
ncbi:MAG: patatin-like phospholipase family protein, partial [Alphaproteobacteria bacterium]|nr:patatin-like phospholipase family protein [Alphaproteobacteria bacterium]